MLAHLESSSDSDWESSGALADCMATAGGGGAGKGEWGAKNIWAGMLHNGQEGSTAAIEEGSVYKSIDLISEERHL